MEIQSSSAHKHPPRSPRGAPAQNHWFPTALRRSKIRRRFPFNFLLCFPIFLVSQFQEIFFGLSFKCGGGRKSQETKGS